MDQALVHDLISVLSQHPTGLRRWTLMRSMRALSEKAHREVTPKFEDDVERAFRHHCEGDSVHAALRDKPAALFYRPKESVGEVWAVRPEAAQAFAEGRVLAA
jgi:hypothetical protein